MSKRILTAYDVDTEEFATVTTEILTMVHDRDVGIKEASVNTDTVVEEPTAVDIQFRITGLDDEAVDAVIRLQEALLNHPDRGDGDE